MLQLKSTQRLLQFCGVKPTPFPGKADDTILGTWHANIVGFLRPRLVVFLSDRSLFCLIDIIEPTDEPIDLATIFRKNLLRALRENKVSQGQMDLVFQEYNEAIVTKTDSRKVLGNLNDIFNRIYFYVEDAVEQNLRIDLRQLEHEVNLMPQRNINWQYSRDVFKQILGTS